MAHPNLRAVDEPSPWHLDVLLVEQSDEQRSDESVSELLEGVGHRMTIVANGGEAIARARAHAPDILIVDVDTPGVDGFLLLNQVRRLHPDTHVILATGNPSIDDAVAATKARADYLVRPLTSRNLLGPVAAVARRREIHAELFESRAGADPLIGESPLIKSVKRDARIVANAAGPVLITGETGTGKQIVARMIHAASPRSDRAMVEVDCALSMPDQVCEQIFGAGGAMSSATGGTILLDHVEALSSVAQAKLMHGLEVGRFEHGATDVRIIAITSADVEALTKAGTFRAELACRLQEHRISLAPLRKRRDDLPMLVEYFCRKHGSRDGVSARVSPAVWAVLTSADFPGNVRQLELVIKHALEFRRGGELQVEHLPLDLRALRADGERGGATNGRPVEVAPLDAAVSVFEHQYLCQTLARTGGNRTRAASMLGISRKSLWAKLKRFEERRPLLTVGWVR